MIHFSHRFIHTIPLILGLFLLSACGGGGSSIESSCYKVATYTTFDPDGNAIQRTTYTYNSHGYLIQEIYDLNMDDIIDITTNYAYDEHGNIIEKSYMGTRIDGLIIDTYTNIYHREGYLTEVRIDQNNDGTDNKILLYNIKGDLVEEGIDREGDGIIEIINTYTNTYDTEGNLIEIRIDLGSTGTANEIRSYDTDRNLIEVQHDWTEDGHIDRIFTYEYDSHNHLTKEKFDMDGDGTYDESDTYINSYDTYGNVIEIQTDIYSDNIVDAIGIYSYQRFDNCTTE